MFREHEYRFIPITLREANAFIKQYHRHSLPVRGLRFAIGLEHMVMPRLIGVAVAGRAVARGFDPKLTLEITRVATDGTPNANSMLYGRVKRIGQLMGYQSIITYTLQSESGASLKAVQATPVAILKGREWSCASRPRKSQPVYRHAKIRWEL